MAASAPAEAAGVQRRQWEMGLTHAEFFRILPLALEGRDYRATADAVTLEGDGRRLCIRLAPQAERRIALLRLPVTRVEFEFYGYSAQETVAFLERFERHYRRGGG
ncbi:MAG TPA: hypothetical protein VNN09_10515 [Candidatus Competibacteraceae bacterium]|nr:hypothetical protein [Candidatus Competibacteraceae bacterium]